MIQCQNCGNTISTESNFCRFCGTKFLVSQPTPPQAYDYTPPRPYVWKTDEFQTQTETRKGVDSDMGNPNFDQNYARPLGYYQPQHLAQPFRCPSCMSQFPPRKERRISTAGWIVFAVLLVVFFPLFWIGLLMKEDVTVCQVCRSRVS